MRDIINVYGRHIITEKRFVNMLADYCVFEKDNASRLILNAIVAGKYAKQLANLTTSQFDLPLIKVFAHELSVEDGFQQDRVEDMMRMIVFAINMANQANADYHIEQCDGKYGCINSMGEIIIPFEYDKMKDFVSKFGTHIVCSKTLEGGRIYTPAGEVVFEGDYGFYLTNEDGLWNVGKDGKCGAIYPNGEIVIPFIYKQLSTFNPGGDALLFVAETDTGVGVIDYKGNQIIPPMFSNICNRYDETFEIIEAKLNDRYMYFNIDGSIATITPLVCHTPFTAESYNNNDHHKPKGYTVNGSKFVMSTSQKDITDLSGKILCSLGKFNDGLAVAKDNAWIGYMDASLEYKIKEFWRSNDCRFDECKDFKNGLAEVYKGFKRGLINTKGEFIAAVQYENIIRRDWCVLLRYQAKDIYTPVGSSFQIGDCYILPYSEDSKFKCMVNGIYDIGNFSNGRTFAQYRNFVGVVTSDGKSVEPLEYERFSYWNSLGLHEINVIKQVRRNGQWGKLDLENGFTPFDTEKQQRNEELYISKYQEACKPIPYFLDYQKDSDPCGFKWSNAYKIPIELYSSFLELEKTSTRDELFKWLHTNCETF